METFPPAEVPSATRGNDEQRAREERERRAAQNQLLFRAVNEQIVEMTENFRSDLSDINLVCECWSPSCTGTIRCRLEEFNYSTGP